MRAPVHSRILPIRRHGSRTPRTSRIATCFVFRVAGATGFEWTSSTNRPHVHREVRNARSARSATPVGFQARRAIVRRAAAETDSIASRIESPAERRPRSSRDACRAARFSRSSANPRPWDFRTVTRGGVFLLRRMSRAIRAWRRAWTHATSGNESNDLRVGVARKAFVLERVRYNDRRHSMPHESPRRRNRGALF